jgi:hypothetical protein
MRRENVLGWIERVREWAEIAAGLRENPCANWTDTRLPLPGDEAKPSATILPMPTPPKN